MSNLVFFAKTYSPEYPIFRIIRVSDSELYFVPSSHEIFERRGSPKAPPLEQIAVIYFGVFRRGSGGASVGAAHSTMFWKSLSRSGAAPRDCFVCI